MTEKIDFEAPVEVGYKYERTIRLTVDEIAHFAELSGDFNPLHHNEEIARASRFGGIIACGPHTSSLFMGSCATNLAPGYLMMGMEFQVFFKAPLRPDTDYTLEWTVTEVIPKPKLEGYIAKVDGRIARGEENIVTGNGAGLIIRE